jgi:hypothetical protein
MKIARNVLLAFRRREVLFLLATLVRPTIYPLYLTDGVIWQHLLPFTDAAYRLKLLSAVFAAFAFGFGYRLLFRVANHRGAAGPLPGPEFTSDARVGDQLKVIGYRIDSPSPCLRTLPRAIIILPSECTMAMRR